MDLQSGPTQGCRPEMTGKDVIEPITLLAQNHIDVWVDGGWGVDALLGEQTRSHADLDITATAIFRE